MGQLRVTSDHFDGVFDLSESSIKVGRGKDCHIQLGHRSVSRHHCNLTESDNRLQIEDLGSTYGSFVNGVQISEGTVGYAEIGDKVRFGRVILLYELDLEPLNTIQSPPGEDAPGETDSPQSPSSPKGPQPTPPGLRRPGTPFPFGPKRPGPTSSPPGSRGPGPTSSPPGSKASGPRTSPPGTPSVDPAEAETEKKASFNLAPSRPEAPKSTGRPGKKDEGKKCSLSDFQKEQEEDGDSAKMVASAPKTSHLINRQVERKAPDRKKVGGGIYNRLAGGHKKKTKPQRTDHLAEASEWENQVDDMQGGDNGPNYAAEEDEWEDVWGKQKRRKGGLLSGINPLGWIFGIFGSLGLKARMLLIFCGFLLLAGAAHTGYQKATAHILVPKPSLANKDKPDTDGKTTGTEVGDKVLGKAMETFRTIIPDELEDE